MPWTFSHPVAVLPLAKWLKNSPLLAAAVIGSLTPDAGYYCDRFLVAQKAHKWSGLLEYCVPIGLALLLLWIVFRKALLMLLPEPHCGILLSRCGEISCSLLTWLMVPVVVWFGAATHVAWDSFTHKTGYMVKLLPQLTNQIEGIGVYQILQYASTLFGAGLLLMMYYRLWRRESGKLLEQGQGKCCGIWLLGAVLCFAWGARHGWLWMQDYQGLLAFRVFTFRTAVHASVAGFLCIFIACIVSWLTLHWRKIRGASETRLK